MNEDTQWRVVVEKDNIVNMIDFLGQQRSDVVVWQSFEGQRLTCDCLVDSFDPEGLQFTIIPHDLNHRFNADHDYFIYSEEHQIILKCRGLNEDEEKISFNVPNKCLAHEKRRMPRDIFEAGEGPMLSFTKPEYEKVPTIFKKEVFDFSEDGLSFRVTKNEEKHFFVGDSILVKSLVKSKNGEQMKGRIRYIKRQYDSVKNTDYFRVGIVFSQNRIPSLVQRAA